MAGWAACGSALTMDRSAAGGAAPPAGQHGQHRIGNDHADEAPNSSTTTRTECCACAEGRQQTSARIISRPRIPPAGSRLRAVA